MAVDTELARRLVACKHFRWMPGMRDAVDGDTCIGQDAPNSLWQWAGGGWASINEGHEWRPNLADPATLGCLLALVREAWGDDGATTQDRRKGAQGWWVWLSDPTKFDTPVREAATEAEALVAALEAAP